MNCSYSTIIRLRKECIKNGKWFTKEELEEIKLSREKSFERLESRKQLYRRTKNTL